MKLFKLDLTDKQLRNFWKKVAVRGNNECWNWTASKHIIWKYGHFNVNGAILKAHRISYYITNGAFDDSLKVCHSCDNPSCVNPNHLFLGTDLDNNKDMVRKGRQRHQKGEENGSAKLTEEQVIKIRNLYATGEYSLQKLSNMFGTDKSNIGRIINGEKWKYLLNRR